MGVTSRASVNLWVALFFSAVFISHATRTCGSPGQDSSARRIVQERLEQYRAERDEFGRRGSSERLVPVQWHVVNDDNNTPQVGDDAINQTMCILNDAFAGSSLVFSSIGVTRTSNSAWSSCNNADMYNALSVDTERVLNIYLCTDADGSLGFAYLPGGLTPGNVRDAAHARIDTMPGGTNFPYNQGDTVTHEVGHWVGLNHVFRDQFPFSCAVDNDNIADTPNQIDPTGGCPTMAVASCGDSRNGGLGGPNYRNFMDYTDDQCMVEFTQGQFDYIVAAMDSLRPNVGDGYTNSGAGNCGGTASDGTDGGGGSGDGGSGDGGSGSSDGGDGDAFYNNVPAVVGVSVAVGLVVAVCVCIIVVVFIMIIVMASVVMILLRAGSFLASSSTGETFVESSYVESNGTPMVRTKSIPKPSPKADGNVRYKTMKWSFDAENAKELTVPVHARVEVLREMGEWTSVRFQGRQGFVPTNYLG